MSTPMRREIQVLPLDDSPTVWPVINHTRKNSHHVEIYRTRAGWCWQKCAGNGLPICGSLEGYGYHRKRDLVHGLEVATGMRMLDQDQKLVGGSWYLWGVSLPYEDFLEAGKQTTKLVEGVVIPVRVPAGTQWTSRRPR